MWKVKNKEPVVQEEFQEANLESDEIEELQNKIKELENRKKVPEIKPRVQVREQDAGLNKQEVIDAIQGNLSRASQLIELLRR